VADALHATLTANTVTTLTLDQDYGTCEVVNVDGTAAVYFVVNSPTAPTVGGRGTLLLPAAICGLELYPDGAQFTEVKLISTGTPKVHIRGY